MAANKTAPAGWTPAQGDDHIQKPPELTFESAGSNDQRPDISSSAACTCRSRGECMTCRRHIHRSLQREERRAAMKTNRGRA